jgi:hypothetical protein
MGWFSNLLSGNKRAEFHERMQRVVTALGLNVLQTDENGVMVGVPHNGFEYWMMVFSFDGRDVAATTLSVVKFPPQQLPEDVCHLLDEMNREMRTCQYEPHRGRRHWRFSVKTVFPVRILTPDMFSDLLTETVARAWAVDKYLFDNGYAR